MLLSMRFKSAHREIAGISSQLFKTTNLVGAKVGRGFISNERKTAIINSMHSSRQRQPVSFSRLLDRAKDMTSSQGWQNSLLVRMKGRWD